MVGFQPVRECNYTREARGMLGPQQIQLDGVPTDANERGNRIGGIRQRLLFDVSLLKLQSAFLNLAGRAFPCRGALGCYD